MKWVHVIKYNLNTMIQNNVLTPVKTEDEHCVTRPLGISWVLKIKDNGRYHAILVSKGFLK